MKRKTTRLPFINEIQEKKHSINVCGFRTRDKEITNNPYNRCASATNLLCYLNILLISYKHKFYLFYIKNYSPVTPRFF